MAVPARAGAPGAGCGPHGGGGVAPLRAARPYQNKSAARPLAAGRARAAQLGLPAAGAAPGPPAPPLRHRHRYRQRHRHRHRAAMAHSAPLGLLEQGCPIQVEHDRKRRQFTVRLNGKGRRSGLPGTLPAALRPRFRLAGDTDSRSFSAPAVPPPSSPLPSFPPFPSPFLPPPSLFLVVPPLFPVLTYFPCSLLPPCPVSRCAFPRTLRPAAVCPPPVPPSPSCTPEPSPGEMWASLGSLGWAGLWSPMVARAGWGHCRGPPRQVPLGDVGVPALGTFLQ